MTLDTTLLRDSFELILERQPRVTQRFYELLFAHHPQTKQLFGAGASLRQEEMLQSALVAVLDHLDDASWLEQTLTAMGAKHVEYGVTDEMYWWVGATLLATLAEVAGPDWNERLASAWGAAYAAIAALMLRGAEQARSST